MKGKYLVTLNKASVYFFRFMLLSIFMQREFKFLPILIEIEEKKMPKIF
jgi:hypothetical protein